MDYRHWTSRVGLPSLARLLGGPHPPVVLHGPRLPPGRMASGWWRALGRALVMLCFNVTWCCAFRSRETARGATGTNLRNASEERAEPLHSRRAIAEPLAPGYSW